jgi:magnesium transporter
MANRAQLQEALPIAQPEPGVGVRALLFAEGRPTRSLEQHEIPTTASLPDTHLVWIDVSGSQIPQNLWQALQFDPAMMIEGGPRHGDVQRQDGWTYLHPRALDWKASERLQDVPLGVAIGRNAVVTFHPEPLEFISAVRDGAMDNLRAGQLCSMSFAIALLDRLLTAYLDVRDGFETMLDRLELLVLRRPSSRHLQDLQRLRRSASRLRRLLAAQRDLYDAIGRPDFDAALPDPVAQQCRNLSTRFAKIMASVEGTREMVNGGFELYASRTAADTSREMHTLTVVIVVTCITATLSGLMGAGVTIDFLGDGEAFFLWSAGAISLLVVLTVTWAVYRLIFKGR